MKRTLLIVITAALVTLAMFAGCKKPDNAIPTKYGILKLNIQNKVGNTDLVLGHPYGFVFGVDSVHLSILSSRYYISNVKMVDAGGNLIVIPGTILVVADSNEYEIGAVPVGSYKSITFDVGLRPYDNHLSPTVYNDGIALGPQNPPMHFSTIDSGYFFFDIRGNIDTAMGGANPSVPFSCQVGLDGNEPRITLPDHDPFVVVEAQPLSINLIADYTYFFRHVNLVQQRYINPKTVQGSSHLISEDISVMFRYAQ